jgi:hypothetical protein
MGRCCCVPSHRDAHAQRGIRAFVEHDFSKPVPTFPDHAAQDQIQRRARRADRAGTRATRGSGTSKSAINAATALTIQRFMVFASPSWVQPQINVSMERNGLPWRDGNNGEDSTVE